MEKPGVSLQRVAGFPSQHLDRLAKYNITTAEEFVALTNTAEQANRVADLLGVSLDELKQLIALAKSSLPEAVRKEMEAPIDTSQYGLGALDPRFRGRGKPSE